MTGVILAAIVAGINRRYGGKGMNLHKPDVKVTDAGEALQLLKGGNKRYLSRQLSEKINYEEIKQALAEGQKPFAIVLCCADSRVAPEICFDQ